MASLPTPFSDIPRVRLLFDRPSDIEPLGRMTKVLDCGTAFWIKHEDCSSGLAFGGNKVRKLEYVLADALDKGADVLVTTGGIQSNHMRQTAAAAARLGLKVALWPLNRVPSVHDEYRSLGNVQLNHILGAETFPVDSSEADVLQAIRDRGQTPYPIPGGASTHPLGGLGFARWAFEVLAQEKQLGVTFDTIVAVAGSGSTLGGMIAGFKLAQKLQYAGAKKRIVGFMIRDTSKEDIRKQILEIARATATRIGLSADDVSAQDFELHDEYLGGGYGVLDDVTADGIKEFARLEGILTDPVYTGKAATGMLHFAKAKKFADGGNVLFCHSGGQVALSAYPQLH